MKIILGKKIGMTQVFEKDQVVPLTVIEAGPCSVLRVKNQEGKDNYDAIQLGYEKKKNKPRFIKEFRGKGEVKQGDELKVDIFQPGDEIKITGISKGKGFAGAVKKWNFKGKSATHGTKHEERTIGSIGSQFPQRVIKGKKMPGRMGSNRNTICKKIIKVDLEKNIIAVKGAVPGKKGTLLEIYEKTV